MTAMTVVKAAVAGALPFEVDSFKMGQRVDGLLYLERAASDNARNGKWYVRLAFRDVRGVKIDGKLWDCADDAPATGVYRVVAAVDEYKGAKQLKLLRAPSAAPEIDPSPYLVAVRPERAGAARLREQFLAALAEIKHTQLAPLLANV